MSAPNLDPVNGCDRCVKLMLSRHAESLAIARALATMGERFIGKPEIQANNPLQVLPACIPIRQISGLRSLCLLAVNGFYTEAWAISGASWKRWRASPHSPRIPT